MNDQPSRVHQYFAQRVSREVRSEWEYDFTTWGDCFAALREATGYYRGKGEGLVIGFFVGVVAGAAAMLAWLQW